MGSPLTGTFRTVRVTTGWLFTVQTLETVPAVVTWLKLCGLLITGTKKLAAVTIVRLLSIR